MVQRHESSFTSFENAHLALQSRIKLVDQELKNHIDTTSSEYGELKVMHSESTDQMNEKYQETSSSIKLDGETNCEMMHNKISQMDAVSKNMKHSKR